MQYVESKNHYSDSFNFRSLSSIHCWYQFLLLTLRAVQNYIKGAQWLSGRVLDSRPKGRGFEPHRRHCVVSLSKNINPSLVLVQPRKTRLLLGRKESNQTNKQNYIMKLLVASQVSDQFPLGYLSNEIFDTFTIFTHCGFSLESP